MKHGGHAVDDGVADRMPRVFEIDVTCCVSCRSPAASLRSQPVAQTMLVRLHAVVANEIEAMW
jgi:hypothetical protein